MRDTITAVGTRRAADRSSARRRVAALSALLDAQPELRPLIQQDLDAGDELVLALGVVATVRSASWSSCKPRAKIEALAFQTTVQASA